jgi:hypothetical protein
MGLQNQSYYYCASTVSLEVIYLSMKTVHRKRSVCGAVAAITERVDLSSLTWYRTLPLSPPLDRPTLAFHADCQAMKATIILVEQEAPAYAPQGTNCITMYNYTQARDNVKINPFCSNEKKGT